MTSTLPLLHARDLAAPLAWSKGEAMSAGQFIAEAQALAATLPEGRPVNLCQDRVHFALGLAAALIRGQTSLMPPNALPETLAQIPAQGGAPYLLIDDEPPATGGLRTHRVQRLPGAVPAAAVPSRFSAPSGFSAYNCCRSPESRMGSRQVRKRFSINVCCT